jgi:hypothetical protein
MAKNEGTKRAGVEIELEARRVGQADLIEEGARVVRMPEAATEKEPVSRLPWFAEAWLYPLSAGGMLRIVSLCVLLFVLCPAMVAGIGLGNEYMPLVYLLPFAYVFYYFTECIRDSAGGGRRAPDLFGSSADHWDCIGQMFLVVGCAAICFLPVSAYYIATSRTDWVFWLLLGAGGIYCPMAILSAVLQDSFSGLNPVEVVRLMVRKPLSYAGRVVMIWVLAALIAIVDPGGGFFGLFAFGSLLRRAAQMYLLFAMAEVLGRGSSEEWRIANE